MRSNWEALHAGLVRSTRTLKAAQAFNQAKQQHPELAGFSEPGAVVAFLATRDGDRDAKDHLLAALVTLVQQREQGNLAATLLWLGLWPGLDAIYRRRLRHFLHAPSELVSGLAAAFSEQIDELSLQAVTRVAATLVRSTERRLLEERVRVWKEQARVELCAEDVIATLEPSEARPESTLGLRPCLTFDNEVVQLRNWLTPVAGDDTELLLGVLALGETQHEAGERLGVSKAAARKRFQRALGRVREHLASSLSHSDQGTRV